MILTDEDFLHGHCDEWVIGNYIDGDKILILLEHDKSIEMAAILHCALVRDSYFLDVRGPMDTLDDVLDEFDYGEYQEVYCSSLDSFFITMQKIYQNENCFTKCS